MGRKPCASGFQVMKDTAVQGLYHLALKRRTAEARHFVTVLSQHQGPERSLREAVKVKPGFC